ncbi:gas vesicle protein K [Actinoallomurus sp. NPDC052274]|uniref:gas vesicle protein K n=1 Tax=Actinoallomurus sp. NPDC052274 TaxID=3155420 RepID=UPI00341371DB
MTEPFDARPHDPDAVLPEGAPVRRGGRRIEADSETVQRDLAQLVLTVVELVRQLVERQCIRRVDQGDLSDEQVEEIGVTLMRLEEAMEELCERFGLSMSDLNLDLGPLGTLLPTDQD